VQPGYTAGVNTAFYVRALEFHSLRFTLINY
jgi:hypothetical protein